MGDEQKQDGFIAWFNKRFNGIAIGYNRMEDMADAWSDSAAHSAARISELEGRVAMLRNILDLRLTCDDSCKCSGRLALTATAQTAEEYRKRVQAEALEEAARHIERFGKHVGWHHAAKDWPTDARQAIEIFSEHESAELMRMASELSNPAAQAEGSKT